MNILFFIICFGVCLLLGIVTISLLLLSSGGPSSAISASGQEEAQRTEQPATKTVRAKVSRQLVRCPAGIGRRNGNFIERLTQ